MHNSFISQWSCSITWGTRKWNLGYDLLGVSYTHPFKAYTPDKVSVRMFCSAYFSWLDPIVWPRRLLLSKKSTPWKYFGGECNARIFWDKRILLVLGYFFVYVASNGISYQFGNSTVPIRVRVLKQKMAVLYLGWWRHSLSSHYQKLARKWSESRGKNCAEPSQLHHSPKIISNYPRSTNFM